MVTVYKPKFVCTATGDINRIQSQSPVKTTSYDADLSLPCIVEYLQVLDRFWQMHSTQLTSILQQQHLTHAPVNGPLSRSARVSWYQKGKTNLDSTETRDSEWQWNQLGRMQVCTSLQTDNHASTPSLSFLQAECPSCCPTNSVKALKALTAAY